MSNIASYIDINLNNFNKYEHSGVDYSAYDRTLL